MHKNFAYYAGIMLILLATYYAPNYADMIGAGLQQVASQHKVVEPSNPVKVLGMYWNTESDMLYVSPNLDTTFPPTMTKRDVLKWSSSIFDPLGLLSPVTISAKLFPQQLW